MDEEWDLPDEGATPQQTLQTNSNTPAAQDASGTAPDSGSFWSSIGAGFNSIVQYATTPQGAALINTALGSKTTNPTAGNSKPGIPSNYSQGGTARPVTLDYVASQSSGISVFTLLLLLAAYLIAKKKRII